MGKLPAWLATPDKGKRFLSNNFVVVDVETTNLEKGHPRNPKNKLVLATWLLGPSHPNTRKKSASTSESPQIRGVNSPGINDVKWCYDDEYGQERLVHDVSLCDFIVCHNAKFDLGWIVRAGVGIRDVLVWCTQVAEYVNRSNRQGGLSLEASLERHGFQGKEKLVSTLLKGGICPSEIPKSLLVKYGRLDTLRTYQLFEKQRNNYLALFPAISTRCYAIPMLLDLELRGIKITEEAVTTHKSSQSALTSIEKTFRDFTGGVNFNSPDQVAEYIYDKLKFTEPIDPKTGEGYRTPGGKRKASKEVIALLKPKTDEQRAFLELQVALAQLDSDNAVLSKLADCYKNNEGILHFNFNNTVVATGRLSSNGAQYKQQGQNLARKFKRLFGPRKPGFLIGEIDYPNLEWRIAGHYGRDKTLRADVLSGFDVHKFSAGVFGISRQAAKAETFRPLFGSKGSTPKQRLYAKQFRERWYGVDAAQRAWADECLRTGSVSTETGWKFYWPAKLTRTGYIEYTTKIYDYPIQYFAGAECTLTAALMMWYLGADMESFMVNTVHDSVIWEIKEEEKEEWKQMGLDCYTKMLYTYLYDQYGIEMYIPLGADFKIGPLWSVGEEEKIDVTIDGKELRIRK